jgi:hypothetical protein
MAKVGENLRLPVYFTIYFYLFKGKLAIIAAAVLLPGKPVLPSARVIPIAGSYTGTIQPKLSSLRPSLMSVSHFLIDGAVFHWSTSKCMTKSL